MKMFGDRPGYRESIEGGGASSDFIKNDEGVFGGVVDDERGFVHLDHEGRLPFGKIVGSANPAENSVGQANVSMLGRDISSDLSHQGDEGNLSDVGRFSGHVGAGEELKEALFRINEGIVRNELFFHEGLLQDRVAAVHDLEVPGLVEDRAGVLVELGGFGKGNENV